MGAKIPQQSSPRHGCALCGYHILRKLLKNGAPKQEAWTPIFIDAHIQLAGCDLANNHTFKLLSGLLLQTLSKKNITWDHVAVNVESPSGRPEKRMKIRSCKSKTGTCCPHGGSRRLNCRYPFFDMCVYNIPRWRSYPELHQGVLIVHF